MKKINLIWILTLLCIIPTASAIIPECENFMSPNTHCMILTKPMVCQTYNYVITDSTGAEVKKETISEWVTNTNIYNISVNISDTGIYLLKINETCNTTDQLETNFTSILTIGDGREYNLWISDVGELVVTKDYNAKAIIQNEYGEMVNASEVRITLINPLGQVIKDKESMTYEIDGVYVYTYTTLSADTSGVWRSVINATTKNYDVIQREDSWELESNAPEVGIKVPDKTIPKITCEINVTNEGTEGQEYTLYWWVTDTSGGLYNSSIDSGSASKWINPSQTYITAKELEVGDREGETLWCKVQVFWSETESSSASEQFIAEANPIGASGRCDEGEILFQGTCVSKEKAEMFVDFPTPIVAQIEKDLKEMPWWAKFLYGLLIIVILLLLFIILYCFNLFFLKKRKKKKRPYPFE